MSDLLDELLFVYLVLVLLLLALVDVVLRDEGDGRAVLVDGGDVLGVLVAGRQVGHGDAVLGRRHRGGRAHRNSQRRGDAAGHVGQRLGLGRAARVHRHQRAVCPEQTMLTF